MTEVIVIQNRHREEVVEPIQVSSLLSDWMTEIEKADREEVISVWEDGPPEHNEWSMSFLYDGIAWTQTEGQQFFSDVPCVVCNPVSDAARIRNRCRSKLKPTPSPMEIPF